MIGFILLIALLALFANNVLGVPIYPQCLPADPSAACTQNIIDSVKFLGGAASLWGWLFIISCVIVCTLFILGIIGGAVYYSRNKESY